MRREKKEPMKNIMERRFNMSKEDLIWGIYGIILLLGIGTWIYLAWRGNLI